MSPLMMQSVGLRAADTLDDDLASLTAQLAVAKEDAERWTVVNEAVRARSYERVLIALNHLTSRGVVKPSFLADFVRYAF